MVCSKISMIFQVVFSYALRSSGRVLDNTMRAGVETDLNDRTMNFIIVLWVDMSTVLHHLYLRAVGTSIVGTNTTL